ncbi:MAG: hypothetical protein WC384_01460 [Prolixibacteraceae bacterium]
MEILFKYYGLDWISIFLNLMAVIQLGNKSKWGFVIFIAANLFWIAIGITLLQSYAIAFGNSIFLITNIRGFIKWHRQDAINIPAENPVNIPC